MPERERTFRLAEVNGKARRLGYDEPAMQIVARNERVLVCKMPGHSFNHSGIRGMRDDRYIASEMRVFEVVRREPEWLVVKELIAWPTKSPRAA